MFKFLIAFTFISLNAYAAPSLTAGEERALLAELNEIADNAGVANGGTDLVAQTAKFDMNTAMALIEEERPTVYGTDENGDDNLADIKHTFKTIADSAKAIKYLKTDEAIQANDPDTGAKIESLKDRGLLRAILHRTTDTIFRETWLIPELFDIYVEYEVNGQVKGQLLRLHYELGD